MICLSLSSSVFQGKLHYGSPIIKTNKCTHIYCIILKYTLKHLKISYMFRSIDHHQGAHVVPC
jgi:hypothetical protein